MIKILFCFIVCLLSIAFMLYKDKIKALGLKLLKGKENKKESNFLSLYEQVQNITTDGSINALDEASFAYLDSSVTIVSEHEIKLPIVYNTFQLSEQIEHKPAFKICTDDNKEYLLILSSKMSIKHESSNFIQIMSDLTDKNIVSK